jgi:hypothetical protein
MPIFNDPRLYTRILDPDTDERLLAGMAADSAEPQTWVKAAPVDPHWACQNEYTNGRWVNWTTTLTLEEYRLRGLS